MPEPADPDSPVRPIATRNEGPLHAALKAWYAQPGDRLEVPLDGRQIDVVRGDLLIEIQTGGFAPLRRKLEILVEEHRVRLVHPIPYEKWIVRVEGEERTLLGRRKSPQRGRLEDVFEQLVSLPRLLAHPAFSLEVLLTREEEVRRQEPGLRRRKGWGIVERRLVEVVDRRVLRGPADLLALLPAGLPEEFTTRDLADGLQMSRDLAQKMAYCLREAGAVVACGKQGNARTYRRPP